MSLFKRKPKEETFTKSQILNFYTNELRWLHLIANHRGWNIKQLSNPDSLPDEERTYLAKFFLDLGRINEVFRKSGAENG